MFKFILNKIIGSWHDRFLKKIIPVITEINGLEEKYINMPDEELFAMTNYFKEQLTAGKELDDVLPDAFATVREVSKRVMGMRHYDVQLMGGYVLHKGHISEMKTGEGKTLVATLPLYTNALEGKGAHLVTVNDYLAKRDACWMAPIYMKLGLTVGIIQNDKSKKVIWADASEASVTTIDVTRQEAYNCDITYGTNNEYGFDYLRDNMKYEKSTYVQRELHYAIVDEVDSILIDEARTPLIISGPTEESTDKYYIINNVVKNLVRDEHYTVDEKRRTAVLNDNGINYVESKLNVGNLFDVSNVDMLHFVNNALKAHAIFKLDVDYMITDGQVVIVDEFTGRPMPGRRFSDGLHQALEAKEGVKIQNENQTLASITFQNYFRMYTKLSGMTGTAITEAEEFNQIYSLSVVPIPTHREMVRKDMADVIYRTAREKYEAIANQIAELHKNGQPVLVGTVSIEKSEFLSRYLTKLKIPHEVLNAKNHEREASIVENAGQRGAVTIATNMAGRGTDIKLGEGVKELGGLFILGTERHESRRIDNQLRGRSGRQGDPGASRFYLSMDDDLLRIFGAERISSLMDRLGMQDGEPIEHSLVTRAIEGAQKKVEAQNFEVRKHLLEYDNVANQQRQVIYGLRRAIISGENIDDIVRELSDEIADDFYDRYIMEGKDEEAFSKAVTALYGAAPDLSSVKAEDSASYKKALEQVLYKRLEERKEELAEHYDGLGRYLLVSVIDSRWKEHLLQMDYLRDSVGLRGYGQKDPLIEYKRESFAVFSEMYTRICVEAMNAMMHVRLMTDGEIPKHQQQRKVREERRNVMESASQEPARKDPVRRTFPKVGKNELCPCGSGKKYKNCHGAS